MGVHSTSGNQEKTSQRVRKEINGFSDVHRAVLDLGILSSGSESIERINLLVKDRFFQDVSRFARSRLGKQLCITINTRNHVLRSSSCLSHSAEAA